MRSNLCGTPRGRSRWKPLLATLALGFGACATNPATGEREFTLVTEAQEIELGRQSARQVEQAFAFVDNPAVQSYVERLGQRLAVVSERPELPWSFRVIDDPTPNAFALPGGFIYVTRGLLSLMDSEAELAGVLGHEIAHVTARHAAQAITRQQIAQVGLGVGSILVPELQQFGNVLGGGLQLLFLKYGRGAEREADDFGFNYALQAGYDVREFEDVFLSLQRIGELQQRSGLPTWLSTHPAEAERIQRARERVAALPDTARRGRLGHAEFLQLLDGMVYGENPRQGFFREGVFYHPDLRFRLAFPAQWKTQNMAQAVVAVSPQQNAIAQLTLAGNAGATEALRAFLSQQGVQAGATSRETINGSPAAVGYFQAQTQQGVIRGLVGFLEHQGRTYQVLSYAPAGAFGQYEPVFRQILGSFAPVNDPQILGVQPDRIDIVRLDRTMSLAEFNRRFPSDIPLNELVILNQAPDEGTPLPSGALVKRVVPGSGGGN